MGGVVGQRENVGACARLEILSTRTNFSDISRKNRLYASETRYRHRQETPCPKKVCVCLCVQARKQTLIPRSINLDVYMCVCVCARVCVRTHACSKGCIGAKSVVTEQNATVHIHTCIYRYRCVCVYIHIIYIYIYSYIYTFVCVCVFICACLCMYIYIYIHPQLCSQVSYML